MYREKLLRLVMSRDTIDGLALNDVFPCEGGEEQGGGLSFWVDWNGISVELTFTLCYLSSARLGSRD